MNSVSVFVFVHLNVYLSEVSKLMFDSLSKVQRILALGTLSMGQLRTTELPSSAFDDNLSTRRSNTAK